MVVRLVRHQIRRKKIWALRAQNFVNSFSLREIRFKHWKPNKFFDNWHSEHGSETPNRILNFMIYLSTHECGTKFFDGNYIKSKKGRLAIFPSYFTHTHRGNPPLGGTKYIATSWGMIQ